MDQNCTILGDGDLYGLGVRLGLYFQWMAGFLLRNFNGSWKTISTVRIANNALGTAIMLTTMINIWRGIYLATDFLIVYYLVVALFYAESYNLMTKSDSSRNGFVFVLTSDMPLLIQNLLFATASLFGGWFWIRGVLDAPKPPCGAWAAVIVSFQMDNLHWRRFAAVFSILFGIIFSFFLFVHLIGFWGRQVTRQSVIYIARALSYASGSPTLITTGLQPLLRPRAGHIAWGLMRGFRCQAIGLLLQFLIVNLLGPIIAMSSVEAMIRQNGLLTSGVLDSSGQMIALTTGVTSLFISLWEIGEDLYNRRRTQQRDLASLLTGISTRALELEELRGFMTQLSTWISQTEGHRGIRRNPNHSDIDIADFRKTEEQEIRPHGAGGTGSGSSKGRSQRSRQASSVVQGAPSSVSVQGTSQEPLAQHQANSPSEVMTPASAFPQSESER